MRVFEKKVLIVVKLKGAMNKFMWVSIEQINKSREMLRDGDASCCDTCEAYQSPGFIVNANQWVNCPQCNAEGKPVAHLQKWEFSR